MLMITMAFVAFVVVTTVILCLGLFDARVDNGMIFKMLGSWGDRIVSALTVILGAKFMGNRRV